jgi:hypothetical protein
MIFISYRRSDTPVYADWISDWLGDYLPVEEIYYDRDIIEPGENWREHIRTMIPQCQGMIVLIGPTWLGDRLFEPNDTVRGEIELALASGIPVIPLLVQNASMPNSGQLPDSLKSLSSINALPLRMGRDNRKRDWEKLSKAMATRMGITVPAHVSTDQEELRYTLLRLGYQQVRDGKQAALSGLPFMDLGLAEHPGMITPPYPRIIPVDADTLIDFPPHTPIHEIYEHSAQSTSLAIFGNPGAGKSTLLLELEEGLLQKAKGRTAPVPILLKLSSWTAKTPSLSEWLSTAIREQYGLLDQTVKTIIEQVPLILLLDGLDEAPENARTHCIEHINSHLQANRQSARMIICSRIDEYQEANCPLEV